jgi:hypothetical protein
MMTRLRFAIVVAIVLALGYAGCVRENPAKPAPTASRPEMTEQQAVDKFIEVLSAKMPKDWAAAPVEKGTVCLWYWRPSQGPGVQIHLSPKRLLERDGQPGGLFVWLMEPAYTAQQPSKDNVVRQTWPPKQFAVWRGKRVMIWRAEEGDWLTCKADLKAALKATDKVVTTQPAAKPAPAGD